jgi:alginate O-acetyltransferase complex protein AlgI
MKDFWQRWHISLSSWFRDYVYIPLGGNRRGLNRTYVNLFIVFLLTGFWHGATWSFVVWGMFHGLFLVIEKLGFDKVLKRLPSFVGWAYTMLVVLLAWVFFRIENLGDAVEYIVKLFGGTDSGPTTLITYLNNERILVLILALLASSTFFVWTKRQIEKLIPSGRTFHSLLSDFGVLAMFLYSVLYIISDSYNPFIYFRF